MSNLAQGRKVIDLRKWHARETARARARASRIEFPQQRKPTLRARRRKLRVLAGFILIVLLFGVIKGVGALSYLPQLSINSISIEGAKEVQQELVREYVETILNDGSQPLLSRSNIFLYPRADIENAIPGNFPRIHSADISRSSLFDQAITVTVAERQPFALWCSDGEICYLMDDSGFIFAPFEASPQRGLEADDGSPAVLTQSSTTTPGMPVFRGGLPEQSAASAETEDTANAPIGQTFLPEHLEGVIEILERLRQAGYSLNGASVIDDQDFSISFSDGFVLRASFGNDAGALVRNLELALSSDTLLSKVGELEYIDMRFGNRVYYKFRK